MHVASVMSHLILYKSDSLEPPHPLSPLPHLRMSHIFGWTQPWGL